MEPLAQPAPLRQDASQETAAGISHPHHAVSAEELAHSFEEADVHEVDLSDTGVEEWLTVLLFWIMGGLVFTQFFTRYALNDSYAWTEELATNCLIAVVFIGAASCIRKDRHIQVDVLYRFLPAGAARLLSTLVDLVRVGVLAVIVWLGWQYIGLVGDEPMTTINWPKSIVYWLALLGFALMLARAVVVAARNWRQGYSVLERPEAYDGTGDA
jgi:TRAP-type C4-dicarboxylate transport system permease small subunit